MKYDIQLCDKDARMAEWLGARAKVRGQHLFEKVASDSLCYLGVTPPPPSIESLAKLGKRQWRWIKKNPYISMCKL